MGNDETEIVEGYDPEVDDEEDDEKEEDVEVHHFIVALTGDAPPQRVVDATGLDDVMQRVRSERGRKGDVRFPANGAITSENGTLPVHAIRSDLIASVAEIFPVSCETCEVELVAPYQVDDDGDPICSTCFAEGEDDEDDGLDGVEGDPNGGGRVIDLHRFAADEAAKDENALPVGFS